MEKRGAFKMFATSPFDSTPEVVKPRGWDEALSWQMARCMSLRRVLLKEAPFVH